MHESLVFVPMRMWFTWRIIWTMRVLMMRVVHVTVLVGHRLVHVQVLVSFRQVEI